MNQFWDASNASILVYQTNQPHQSIQKRPYPTSANEQLVNPMPKRSRGKLNFSSCEYCRANKQKCLPVQRAWPGQKCDYCTLKGRPCSEPVIKKGGRPPRSQLLSQSLIFDSPPLDSSIQFVEIAEHNEEFFYVDWRDRVSYGEMLALELDTLRRLKKRMIDLFDKEDLFKQWDEIPGLDKCREFEAFVQMYRRNLLLQPVSCQQTGTSMASDIVSMIYARSQITGPSLGLDEVHQKAISNHVQTLTLASDYGHAMAFQITLLNERCKKLREVRRSVNEEDEDDEEDEDEEEYEENKWMTAWSELLKLRNCFEVHAVGILAEVKLATSRDEPCVKVPLTLLQNPVPMSSCLVPTWLHSSRRNGISDKSWAIDCLGRTWTQICYDEYERAGRHMRTNFVTWDARDTQDILGRSNLHHVCEFSESNLGPNQPSPWSISKFEGWLEIVQRQNCAGQQPLHYVAAAGNLAMCKDLLSQNKLELDVPDQLGRAPIFYAASNGRLSILRALLAHPKQRINIDRIDGKGYTPLYIALYNNHTSVVEYLLRWGPDINIRPNTKRAPLLLAVTRNDIHMVRLLGSFVDINSSVDNDGRDTTPLFEAIRIGFIEGVQYLTEHPNIDINKILKGDSALYRAVENEETVIVKILLKHSKIDVNLRSHETTPLILAVDLGRDEIVRALLKHPRTDLDLKHRGKTALDFARKHEEANMIDMIKSKLREREISPELDSDSSDEDAG